MYVQLNIVCTKHLSKAISAGEPNDIWRYFEDTSTYELDASNLYCTGGDGEHEFVVTGSTSDGVSFTVPIPNDGPYEL